MRRTPLFALLSILLLHVIVLNVSAATLTITAAPSIAIPDGNSTLCTNTDPVGSITTTIYVSNSFTIADLDVMLDISHTWVGDLQVQLTSPSSTTVMLIDRVGRPPAAVSCGSSSNNINTTLDDESPNGPVENAYPPTGASYTPENPLSAFDGENSRGVWTLTVIDNVQWDTGTLNSWGLIFNTPPTTPSDGDGDGIPDTADNCPLRGDEGNGVDSNGCPIHVWVRPDDRVNWHHGDLSTVVYSHGDGAAVYCHSNDLTWLAMHITPEIVNNADPEQPQNIPVMEYEQDGCKTAFYILDSGEYQINMWTYEGKRYELISDTLDFSQPTMRYFDPNE